MNFEKQVCPTPPDEGLQWELRFRQQKDVERRQRCFLAMALALTVASCTLILCELADARSGTDAPPTEEVYWAPFGDEVNHPRRDRAGKIVFVPITQPSRVAR